MKALGKFIRVVHSSQCRFISMHTRTSIVEKDPPMSRYTIYIFQYHLSSDELHRLNE
jgi:hypothetical protein